MFNNGQVLARAFENDWTSAQRGKGDAFMLAVLGMKGDPAGPEILARGATRVTRVTIHGNFAPVMDECRARAWCGRTMLCC